MATLKGRNEDQAWNEVGYIVDVYSTTMYYPYGCGQMLVLE
jgi:hypothetical protein